MLQKFSANVRYCQLAPESRPSASGQNATLIVSFHFVTRTIFFTPQTAAHPPP